MKLIKPLTDRIQKFVQKRGGVLPKLFVWLYASLFISCGLLTIIGICYEFLTKGAVNYTAVNNFVREYFAPSIAGTMAVIGVLLIDRNQDGIPDEWEKDGDNNGKDVSK